MTIRAACSVLLMFILSPASAQSPFDGLTEGDLADGERVSGPLRPLPWN
jgi:hypothetical protein